MSPDQILKIEKALEYIKDILEGTAEKVGIVHIVRSNNEWIKEQKKKKDSTLNFVYKTVIIIILGYIAHRVGLK